MEATVTQTASTPTTTAAPSAPAASAPATPAERPTTFAQAFASDAATQTEASAQPEAATTQPAETTTATAPVHPSAEKTGPIPFDVHKTALENARTKAVAEYKEKFGWAEAVDRSAYEEAARIGQLYQRDKPAYIRQVLAEAVNDPTLAPLVRSEAARVLGSRQQPAAPQAIEPDIPVVDEQGRTVAQAFSAERVKALIAQAVADAIGKEVAPIKADFQTRQQQEQARQQQAEAQKASNTLYEQVTTELQGFKEHEAEIAAVFEKIPGDPATALYRAYAQVVIPKLQAAGQAKALEDLKTKAAASTANPASATVAATKRPKSFSDSSLKW